jgi:hypothetical protein
MPEPVLPTLPDPPSPLRLVRATIPATAQAGVLLVTVVLPAEYGIDPTGIGRATGLYRAPEAAAEPLPEGAAGEAGTVAGSLFKSSTPYRSDEMSLTLAPGEGAEIKAQMNAGERLVFSWTSSGGGVDVDMHGEAADKTGGDRSYWAGEFEEGGHGAFEAPMSGNHGWFWQNLNDTPVTITVKTSGFYRRLFKP